MNRRGFLGALALAPVAAVVAPSVKPAFATGGFIKPKYGYLVGSACGESIMPLSHMSANPARLMQSMFNDSFGASEHSDRTFNEMAAYCDEIVEVSEIDEDIRGNHTSPAA